MNHENLQDAHNDEENSIQVDLEKILQDFDVKIKALQVRVLFEVNSQKDFKRENNRVKVQNLDFNRENRKIAKKKVTNFDTKNIQQLSLISEEHILSIKNSENISEIFIGVVNKEIQVFLNIEDIVVPEDTAQVLIVV